MSDLLAILAPEALLLACAVALLAGVVKGTVGFAMPTILLSGMGSFVSPELALSGLILPTLLTNGWQALRQGLRASWLSVVKFRRFMLVGLVALGLSAQLVRFLPSNVLLLAIGGVVALFALVQLSGWQLSPAQVAHRRVEPLVGGVAGFIGGLSGIWGPPTVLYLNALNTPKQEHVRIQGTIYALGAIALLTAHTASGVVRPSTLSFSLLLVPPALLGMWGGLMIHDRIDQRLFRRFTQVVLVIAGFNLIRRGLMG